MLNNNILVLGSKPQSKLPDIHVDKIYTANGAAEKAMHFRKKYLKNELTSIVGAREFARNEQVSIRIITSKPERIIIRAGKINLPPLLEKYTKLIFLPNSVQWNFQSKFFQNKKLSLLLAEFQHQEKIFNKIVHFLKSIKNKNIQGVSTGFYAILLALEENPNSKIIISGIGMKGGKQFYKSDRSNYFVYDSRARVDRFLIKRLLKKYINRLCTLDGDLAKIANINLWNGNSF
tara:strand:+ start:2283 stop:2981 length:699 start_codon:yes stop_codon:yes gene_type:complete